MAKNNIQISDEKLNNLSQVFMMLSTPIRIKILKMLNGKQAYSAGEISNVVGIEKSLLSYHLTKMRFSGIINSYRLGRNIYYSLALKGISKVMEFIDESEF